MQETPLAVPIDNHFRPEKICLHRSTSTSDGQFRIRNKNELGSQFRFGVLTWCYHSWKRDGTPNMKKAKRKGSPASLGQAIACPVLVVRWIKNKREKSEIKKLQSTRNLDKGIGYFDAESKQEVIDAVSDWLSGANAQILYIGAHGIPTGLVDGKHSTEEIPWKNLGSLLATSRRRFKDPILLFIGACHSGRAPAIWSELNLDVPVSTVVAFEDEPPTEEVIYALEEYLDSCGVIQRGEKLEWAETRFSPQDVDQLSALFGRTSLAVYHKFSSGKVRKYPEASKFPEVAGVSLEEYLNRRQKRSATRQLAKDAEEGANEPERSPEELMRWRRQVKRSNKRILKRSNDPSLPGRPLPRSKKQ